MVEFMRTTVFENKNPSILLSEEDDIQNNMITPKLIEYARVSTSRQNEDRQILALKEMGVPEKNIYIDKMTGKDFNRSMEEYYKTETGGHCGH